MILLMVIFKYEVSIIYIIKNRGLITIEKMVIISKYKNNIKI